MCDGKKNLVKNEMIGGCFFIRMIGNAHMVILNCVNDVLELDLFFDHIRVLSNISGVHCNMAAG